MSSSQIFIFTLFLGLTGVNVLATEISKQIFRYKTSPAKLETQKGANLSLPSPNVGIFDGSGTTIEKYPFLVSIVYRGWQDCAGTIISPNWILVSADCMHGLDPYYITVLAGADSDNAGTQEYGVWQVIIHPRYNHTSGDYNYALVQIAGTFTLDDKVQTVILPSNRAEAGEWLTVVGYGDRSANGNLTEGKMKLLSNKMCENIYRSYSPISLTARQGCFYNKGKTTVCIGDFSDPFVKDGVVYHIVTRMASQGDCTKRAYPVITANIYPAVSWIHKWISL